jgi:hypothetical protein
LSSSSEPWLPYDPTWLVELAKSERPRKKWLHEALADCTLAQARTCCAPKIYGYHFVDAARPNKPGSPWQFDHQIWLGDLGVSLSVIVAVLKGRQIGGFEWH